MQCSLHGDQRQAELQHTLQFHVPNNVIVLAHMAGKNIAIPATVNFAGAVWSPHGVVNTDHVIMLLVLHCPEKVRGVTTCAMTQPSRIVPMAFPIAV